MKGFNWKGWSITAGSFVLFVLSYSFLLDWKTALTFSVLLFIHEMGHLVLCWRKKALATPPIFIPFVGAAISIDPTKFTAVDEAEVGYGGPLWGSVGAVLGLLIYSAIPSHPSFLLTASIVAVALNLINLIPLRPLDGGRITQVIGSWFRYLGLLMVLAAIWFVPANLPFWLVITMIIYSQGENGLIFKGVATFLAGAVMVAVIKITEIPMQLIWIFPVFLGYVHITSFNKVLKIMQVKKMMGNPEGSAIIQERYTPEIIAYWRVKAEEMLYGTKRPLPSIWIRLKWLIYYLFLAAALSTLMYWIFIALAGPYASVD